MTDDFPFDTNKLAEAKGLYAYTERKAYDLLVRAAWLNDGWLTEDHDELAEIAGANPEEWVRLKPALERCFRRSDGRWVSPQLLAEINQRKSKTRRKSSGGQAPAGSLFAPGEVRKTSPSLTTHQGGGEGGEARLDPPASAGPPARGPASWPPIISEHSQSWRDLFVKRAERHARIVRTGTVAGHLGPKELQFLIDRELVTLKQVLRCGNLDTQKKTTLLDHQQWLEDNRGDQT